VLFAVTRYVSALHRIYAFYSSLGYQESPDNTFVLSKMQFWVFLKDIHMHHGCHTLTEMDRVIGANYQKSHYELHNPYEKILQRQFINYLIILSHLEYSQDYHERKETGPLLDYCFSRLMGEKVLCRACQVESPIYAETRRAVNALVHMDQAYAVYQAVSTQRKHPPREPVLKMRQFLFLLRDLELINEDLTPEAVIQVLASVNPTLSDGEGSYNLELEMTFLEFFEALIGCAERYVTEKVVVDAASPCTSSDTTREQSVHSIPESPSQTAIQIAEEELVGSQVNITSPQEIDLYSGVSASTAMFLKFVVGEIKEDSWSTPKREALKSMEGASSRMLSNAKESISRKRSSLKPSGPSLIPPSRQSKTIANLEEASKETEGSEQQLANEETRKFNFWTHQIHIFFVSKFFPHMEKYLELQKRIEDRKLEEARNKLKAVSETDMTMGTSEFESEMVESAEGDDNIEEMEQLLENAH
ncbi:unnamed protein product, partial [Candidula unifasciata]